MGISVQSVDVHGGKLVLFLEFSVSLKDREESVRKKRMYPAHVRELVVSEGVGESLGVVLVDDAIVLHEVLERVKLGLGGICVLKRVSLDVRCCCCCLRGKGRFGDGV